MFNVFKYYNLLTYQHNLILLLLVLYIVQYKKENDKID